MSLLLAHTNWLRGVSMGGVGLDAAAVKKARKQLHHAPVYRDKAAVGDPAAVVGQVIIHGEAVFVEFQNPDAAQTAIQHQRLALQVHARHWEEAEDGRKVITKNLLVLARAFLAPRIELYARHPAFTEIPFFEELPAEGAAE